MLMCNRYVVADYERSQFWVAQTIFKEPNPSTLVAINPPGAKGPKGPLDILSIAIILAVLGGLLLVTAGFLWAFQSRRRKRMQAMGLIADEKLRDSELSLTKGPKEMVIGRPGQFELTESGKRFELGLGLSHELAGGTMPSVVFELPDRHYK